jgi:DNA-binding MarR family transcriptional regulator
MLPLPVDALGKKIFISNGSMTTAGDRLERQGLVERRSSPPSFARSVVKRVRRLHAAARRR